MLWDVYDRAFRQGGSRLVLHAGLAARDGRGVLIPGKPDAGKTTLVAGLVQAGFAYLSDEAAVFDPSTGRLWSFPRPLGMELPTLRLFPGLEERLPPELRNSERMTRPVPPSAVRPRCVGRSCALRYVVMPEYSPGRRTELEPAGRAETLIALARGAFEPSRFAKEGLEPMARAIARAECFRLRSGSLAGAVDAVAGLFD